MDGIFTDTRRNQRQKGHPRTPDPTKKVSKRLFASWIRTWRKELHKWDEKKLAGSGEQEDDQEDEFTTEDMNFLYVQLLFSIPYPKSLCTHFCHMSFKSYSNSNPALGTWTLFPGTTMIILMISLMITTAITKTRTKTRFFETE